MIHKCSAEECIQISMPIYNYQIFIRKQIVGICTTYIFIYSLYLYKRTIYIYIHLKLLDFTKKSVFYGIDKN